MTIRLRGPDSIITLEYEDMTEMGRLSDHINIIYDDLCLRRTESIIISLKYVDMTEMDMTERDIPLLHYNMNI